MYEKPIIKIVMDKKYANDTEGYLQLRVRVDKGYKRRNLGIRLPVTQWDADNELVVNRKDARTINETISKSKRTFELEIEQRELKQEKITRALVDNLLKRGTSSDDCLAFYREYIDNMKKGRKGREGEEIRSHSDNYIRKQESMLNTLTDMYGKISFSQIDYKFIKNLENKASGTMNYETSLSIFIGKFITMLREAQRHGLYDLSKISEYKPPRYIQPDKPYLTYEQVQALADKVYSGEFDSNPNIKLVACFMVVECTSGLRFSDWNRFVIEKLLNHEALKVRAKKNNEPVYIELRKSPVLQKMCHYIRDHKLKFDLSEQETNRILRLSIAPALKLKFKLTTHVGRHTCATLLLSKGYTKTKIANWLGISEKVVSVYAKNIRADIDNEYERLGGL